MLTTALILERIRKILLPSWDAVFYGDDVDAGMVFVEVVPVVVFYPRQTSANFIS